MGRILIIGFGNPLRGDDGFGWHAAHRLAEAPKDDSVRVLAVHQLTPELAEPISEAELVIFIDASHGGAPGTRKCEEIAVNATAATSLAHYFTPTSLLGCTHTIFGASPRALIFTFVADSFDFCESLTPRAEAALPEILQRVLEEVDRKANSPLDESEATMFAEKF